MNRALSLALAVSATTLPSTAQDMIGVSWRGLTYSLDSSTWDVDLVGWSGIDGTRRYAGLTVTDSGTVYVVGNEPRLYTLDPSTGEELSAQPLPAHDFRALAWDATDGTLLAVQSHAAIPDPYDKLWRLDPIRGGGMQVGSLLEPSVQALEFAPNGTLYGYTNGHGLVVIDPDTAEVTDVFPPNGTELIAQWLAFDADGTAYVGDSIIHRIDMATGLETEVGQTGFPGLRGVAFRPVQAVHRAFCFGDGSAAACPCDNTGRKLTGCSHNDLYGAILAATGSSSVAADDLRLNASLLQSFQPGLFFQGSNDLAGGNGLPFGDGLRCVAANVVRLETATSSNHLDASTQVSIASLGGVAPGDTRYYQFWLRSGTVTGCGTGFNTTNAVQVDWMP